MNDRLFRAFAAALLATYPSQFRKNFGVEIDQFLRTMSADSRSVDRAKLLLDLAAGVPREWRDALRRPPSPPIHAPTRRGEPMRNLLRDIRHAGRFLRNSPAFTAAAVVTLALGIGANTAMFTLAEATLLRPLQVHNPHELVVWSWSSSYPHFVEYSRRTDVFQGVLAVGGASRVNLVIDGSAELATGVFVSGNAFDLLGVRPALGRTLLPADDRANGPLVTVLSHDYWRSRFGGDPDVIGRTYRANGRAITVVGVAERGFRGTTLLSTPALFIPAAVSSQLQTGFFSKVDPTTASNFVWLTVIGRLRPDVSVAQATSAMDAMYEKLQPARPGSDRERLRLEPMTTRALGSEATKTRTFVLLLVGAVGLTLLIGCANLASLLLAKATVRRREVGVRLALGATRASVIRQMLVESVMLALLGAACGLLVATFALRIATTFELPGGLTLQSVPLEISRFALLATIALTLVTGLLFGAAPAWRASRTDVLVSLRDDSRGATARSPLRNVLLAAQIVIALVLLAGTGLFARSLRSALNVSPGFETSGVVTASVNVGLARYDATRAEQLYADALERVQALPQVDAAAWGNLIPTRGLFMGQASVESSAQAPNESVTVYGSHVGPDYFRVMRTRVLAGRAFSPDDQATAPLVGIVSDAMAQKYWAGRSAIGGRLEFFDRWITVVGVVENTVVRELGEKPLPQVYLPFQQWLRGRGGIATDAAHLFVRSSAGADAVLPLVRDQLRSLDPELPLYDLRTMDERVARLVMPQRIGVALFTLFSTLALTLATIGIYGVAAYLATLRTREIGVRIALGASTSAIRRLVLTQSIRPVLTGVIVGLALALYAGRVAKAFLFDVSPMDPVTFITVPIIIGVCALIATYIPARRAAKTDPCTALRRE